MTITSLQPRSTPRRQFISREAPPLVPKKPSLLTPVFGKGKRVDGAVVKRKRRRKRALLRPISV